MVPATPSPAAGTASGDALTALLAEAEPGDLFLLSARQHGKAPDADAGFDRMAKLTNSIFSHIVIAVHESGTTPEFAQIRIPVVSAKRHPIVHDPKISLATIQAAVRTPDVRPIGFLSYSMGRRLRPKWADDAQRDTAVEAALSTSLDHVFGSPLVKSLGQAWAAALNTTPLNDNEVALYQAGVDALMQASKKLPEMTCFGLAVRAYGLHDSLALSAKGDFSAEDWATGAMLEQAFGVETTPLPAN